MNWKREVEGCSSGDVSQVALGFLRTDGAFVAWTGESTEKWCKCAEERTESDSERQEATARNVARNGAKSCS
ncbi:hypothetical protein KFL_004050020 [Klebsormidium nitens]|uniref:Uncharacterized protein n=1 Tax=Klebsormidium nitens TaxID=105231 RepID=A0A1Y1IJ63_KLENI|nr:hypothetical protein KFL_004050020 [Klebsormidium nitens]|eukprot:GAQ88158.1 hypothetical protein KFL_004050020 [Klebsormidium nitens]